MGTSDHQAPLWARFRFSVIGGLLSAPPSRGELASRIRELAEKTWRHPTTGKDVRFSEATIERWFYRARHEQDPVRSLRPKLRKDCGSSSVSQELREHIRVLYGDYPYWSYRLHYDNLAAIVRRDPGLAPLPSYSTVRRYMIANGYTRKPRPRRARRSEARALARKQDYEERSFELAHVGALWHLDFHHGSRPVRLPSGETAKPIALCVLDDRSRLICHLQWYLGETAENLVHGLSQALQKRGLPRALQTDNGAAMISDEVTAGLERLGIDHDTTFPYSPQQNGKQESIWCPLEGRLVAMLEGIDDLSLELLNRATQAWIDLDYHRSKHSETGQKPLERYLAGPDVLRECPSSQELRAAFRLDVDRRQRLSDGTVSLDGRRFEIPSAYRHVRGLRLRYARWDYSFIHLIDKKTDTELARIFLLDKEKNADRRRRRVKAGDDTEKTSSPAGSGRKKALPPLLQELLRRHEESGRPPAYLPKDDAAQRAAPNESSEPGEPSDTDNEATGRNDQQGASS